MNKNNKMEEKKYRNDKNIILLERKKKMSYKKRLLLGLTFSSAFVLMACGNNESEESGSSNDENVDNITGEELASVEDLGTENMMEDFEAGDTFRAEEPMSLSILYRDHPNYPLDEDWLMLTELEEITNVSFDFNVAPLSDFDDRRSLLISGGEAPEIMTNTQPGDEQVYVGSGTILPVSDYFHLMPHLTEKLEEWDFEEDLNPLRQVDGKIYMLPSIHEEVRHDYTMAARLDVLEEYDLDIPNTWDEFREVLEVLRDETGNVPYYDRWEGGVVLNYAAPSFGTVAGWGFGSGVVFDEDNDEFVYAPLTDEYRELVEYFSGLVEDGLMNPESFTQEDDIPVNNFVQGDSYFISTNSQEIINNRISIEEMHGEDNDFEIRKIMNPEGPAGPIVGGESPVIGGERLMFGRMLRSDLVERDDFVAVMQFIDWLHYSYEGQLFARWGIEGETYERTDELAGGFRPIGNIDFLGMNPEGTEDIRVDYGFHNGMFAFGGEKEIYMSIMDDEEIEFQEEMNANREVREAVPPHPVAEEQQEQLTMLRATLNDTTDTYTLRYITGQSDVDQYDEFVTALQSQGVDQYMQIINDAYNDYRDEFGE